MNIQIYMFRWVRAWIMQDRSCGPRLCGRGRGLAQTWRGASGARLSPWRRSGLGAAAGRARGARPSTGAAFGPGAAAESRLPPSLVGAPLPPEPCRSTAAPEPGLNPAAPGAPPEPHSRLSLASAPLPPQPRGRPRPAAAVAVETSGCPGAEGAEESGAPGWGTRPALRGPCGGGSAEQPRGLSGTLWVGPCGAHRSCGSAEGPAGLCPPSVGCPGRRATPTSQSHPGSAQGHPGSPQGHPGSPQGHSGPAGSPRPRRATPAPRGSRRERHGPWDLPGPRPSGSGVVSN